MTELEGIPCTTPARTLVDLAASSNERQLKRALERTVELQMFDLVALAAALKRAKSKRRTGRLRRLVSALTDDPLHLASELERLFLELVRTADLP